MPFFVAGYSCSKGRRVVPICLDSDFCTLRLCPFQEVVPNLCLSREAYSEMNEINDQNDSQSGNPDREKENGLAVWSDLMTSLDGDSPSDDDQQYALLRTSKRERVCCQIDASGVPSLPRHAECVVHCCRVQSGFDCIIVAIPI